MPAFVQQIVKTQASGVSYALVPLAATTVGNTLILSAKLSGGASITGITDTKGNTWTINSDAGAPSANNIVASSYQAQSLTTGDTITVTISVTENNCVFVINEYSGVAQTGAYDSGVHVQNTVASGSPTTIAVGPSGPTSHANDLVISSLTSGTNGAWSPDANWTGTVSGVSLAGQAYWSASSNDPAGSTYSVTWTSTVAYGNATVQIVAFAPPATSTDSLAVTDPGTSTGAATISDRHTDTLGVIDSGLSTSTATPTKTGAYTPTSRMIARQTAKVELKNMELGNGRLFVLNSSQTIAGQLAFGPRRMTYDLTEAASDGGVATQDLHLAAALRATKLFTESAL